MLDAALRAAHLDDHLAAAHGDLDDWLETSASSLALVLLLDQIPRNVFRDTAHAFATDPHALAAARAALARGWDQALDLVVRPFLYMPFMHAEDAAAQERSLALFDAFTAAGGEASYLASARRHAETVRRFGRFPTRNRVLARPSTPEEAAFLRGLDDASTV